MEKPNPNQFFDQCIAHALKEKADGIVPDGTLVRKIQTEIYYKEREYCSMNYTKKIKRMNPVVIIILVFILSAATCFAASRINSYVSFSTKTFEEYPAERQVKSAVNYIPDYLDEFSNGFAFKEASVDDIKANDADNNPVAEGKGITFYYEKADSKKGQIMTLSTNRGFSDFSSDSDLKQELIKDGNIDLKYSYVESKLVPEGYVPTEEENQKMEKGELWISYGADKEKTDKVQFIQWEKDDISYTLMDRGYELPKDELAEMAKEIIGTAE
ncbi:hypothetical protein [Clostridium aminobutyricum]|uniref:DUF4367 domain-containing protein n=1 Tax=Clostridium aminobutyricum TaxID=33953 RepID=A0A939D8R5_CLOAM|nr:hypothetical protein [Clostridium aminobutyricum]MBN7773494.1 hypothetical protein [Clostridium aminobutyricum]